MRMTPTRSPTNSPPVVGNVPSDGGTVCDGAGKCVACVAKTDCAAQITACVANTCDAAAHTCGTENVAKGASCTDDGGSFCDGNGVCVGCNQDSDCADTGTLCQIKACDTTTHTCKPNDAAKGTTCNDNGGVVCNDGGVCVAMHCTDGVMDSDETDVDCGGSCGATCTDTTPQQACKVPGDCVSGVCHGSPSKCQPPSCTDGVKNGDETDKDCGGACDAAANGSKTCADKLQCKTNADCKNGSCFGAVGGGLGTCISCGDGVKNGDETGTDCGGACATASNGNKTCPLTTACKVDGDCASGYCDPSAKTCQSKPNGGSCAADGDCGSAHCVSGICCNSLCNGTCQACTAALTAGADGTCGPINAGVSAPAGQCTAATCGNTGRCAAGGACEQVASGTPCSAPGCSAGQLTTAGVCASGACGTGTTAPCAGGLACASATACLASCTTDGDCQSSSTYCSSGSCLPKGANGATCAGNDQCTSGVCGSNGTGNCCAGACSTSDADCGATACDASGQCVYPGISTACGTIRCVGNVTTVHGACSGSGNCMLRSPMTCPGNFVCADATSCGTSCSAAGTAPNATSTGCASGYYCDTTLATPACSNTLKSTGAGCNNSFECVNGDCVSNACN